MGAMQGTCDCCNRERLVRVAASPIGPASFAYCDECLSAGAEPEGTVVYLWEDVADKNWSNIRKTLVEETTVYKDGKYLTLEEWSKQYQPKGD